MNNSAATLLGATSRANLEPAGGFRESECAELVILNRFTVYHLMYVSVTIRDSAQALWNLNREKLCPPVSLIVDDHEVVRLGVRMLFAKDDSYEVVAKPKTELKQFARSQNYYLIVIS